MSSSESSAAISRAVRAGGVRKLAPRLYTTNLRDEPSAIIRRNLWRAIGLLFPGTVVSHRTALDAKPTEGGTVFVSGPYDRIVKLPGVRVRQIAGPGPLEGDTSFAESLWLASNARAFLECLTFERIVGSESPALPREEIEDRLNRIVQHRGEDAANGIRDRARTIAGDLDAADAFTELGGMIGSLLRTREEALRSPASRARAAGEPYDPARLELFGILHAALLSSVAMVRPDSVLDGRAWENLSFIDAYFSNFIEGTRFDIEEAAEIVFHGRIPAARPDDAHDVLGTFRLVSDAREMTLSASDLSFDELVRSLKARHHTIMQARPERNPGSFKAEINRAGRTVFVEPDLVAGTLRQGFDIFRSLRDAFQKAAFMMFLVSEVHPFDDGNGRVGRAMMNAELISGRERRIFIPISYREDYLLALRALSRQKKPTAMIAMLDRAQEYSAAIDFSVLSDALAALERTDAFEEGGGARLRLPREVAR